MHSPNFFNTTLQPSKHTAKQAWLQNLIIADDQSYFNTYIMQLQLIINFI